MQEVLRTIASGSSASNVAWRPSATEAGPTDGIMGRKTRAAIRSFQSREGLQVTGEVSERLMAALRRSEADRHRAPKSSG